MPKNSEKQYVIRSVRVDSFSVKRIRVLLTPDRCRICGFSVIERNHLGPWERMGKEEQDRVKRALSKHRELSHPTSTKPVVSAGERPVAWLGETELNAEPGGEDGNHA